MAHVLTTSSAIRTNGHWGDAVSGNVTIPFAAELINSAAQHPRSRTYTAQELSTGVNEIISAIASNSDYHRYEPFEIAQAAANLQGAFDAQETLPSAIIGLQLLHPLQIRACSALASEHLEGPLVVAVAPLAVAVAPLAVAVAPLAVVAALILARVRMHRGAPGRNDAMTRARAARGTHFSRICSDDNRANHVFFFSFCFCGFAACVHKASTRSAQTGPNLPNAFTRQEKQKSETTYLHENKSPKLHFCMRTTVQNFSYSKRSER